MNDESYLWDMSGPASPFVKKLERLLAEKRSVVKATGRRRRRWLLRVVGGLVASAAAAVALWALAWREAESPPKSEVDPSVAVESPASKDSVAEVEVPAGEAEAKSALALQEPAPGDKPAAAVEPASEEAVLIRAR